MPARHLEAKRSYRVRIFHAIVAIYWPLPLSNRPACAKICECVTVWACSSCAHNARGSGESPAAQEPLPLPRSARTLPSHLHPQLSPERASRAAIEKPEPHLLLIPDENRPDEHIQAHLVVDRPSRRSARGGATRVTRPEGGTKCPKWRRNRAIFGHSGLVSAQLWSPRGDPPRTPVGLVRASSHAFQLLSLAPAPPGTSPRRATGPRRRS